MQLDFSNISTLALKEVKLSNYTLKSTQGRICIKKKQKSRHTSCLPSHAAIQSFCLCHLLPFVLASVCKAAVRRVGSIPLAHCAALAATASMVWAQ